MSHATSQRKSGAAAPAADVDAPRAEATALSQRDQARLAKYERITGADRPIAERFGSIERRPAKRRRTA